MARDTGQISIDFLVGFTIFIIGFIFAVTMVSGLLVGLQSKMIDYDAVAYRTGVILAEDPGQVQVGAPSKNWEYLSPAFKDDVIRLGLAISTDHPNILSRAKVDRFFDGSFFVYPEDYRRMLIFGGTGTYPYNFNITLTPIFNPANAVSIGDPIPLSQSYGYIKRAVFIKEPPGVASFNCPGNPDRFDISLNFPDFYDHERIPLYSIDPLKEKIQLQVSLSNPVVLQDVYWMMYDEGGVLVKIPGQSSLPVQTSEGPAPLYPVNINPPGTIDIEFLPNDLSFADKSSRLVLSFSFNGLDPAISQNYDYSTVSLLPLTLAVLEVCVW